MDGPSTVFYESVEGYAMAMKVGSLGLMFGVTLSC
jgi:hypothetical protein